MTYVARFRRPDDAMRQHVLGAQAGVSESFEALIHEYDRALYRYMYGIVRDRDDARDLTQEVWLRVSSHLAELREPDGFAPWLYRIARNCGLDFVRARKSRFKSADLVSRTEHDDPPDIPDLNDVGPEQHALLFDERRKVWEALGALAEDDRIALFLREYRELPYVEIGLLLGVTTNTAEVRVFRARQRFRRQFAKVDAVAGGCRVSSLELSALVDREAGSAALVGLSQHAERCTSCAERLEAMRAGRKLYRDLAVRTLPDSLILAQLAGSQLSMTAPAASMQVTTLAERVAVSSPFWGFIVGAGAKAAAVVLAVTAGTGIGSYEFPASLPGTPEQPQAEAQIEVAEEFATPIAARDTVSQAIALVPFLEPMGVEMNVASHPSTRPSGAATPVSATATAVPVAKNAGPLVRSLAQAPARVAGRAPVPQVSKFEDASGSPAESVIGEVTEHEPEHGEAHGQEQGSTAGLPAWTGEAPIALMGQIGGKGTHGNTEAGGDTGGTGTGEVHLGGDTSDPAGNLATLSSATNGGDDNGLVNEAGQAGTPPAQPSGSGASQPSSGDKPVVASQTSGPAASSNSPNRDVLAGPQAPGVNTAQPGGPPAAANGQGTGQPNGPGKDSDNSSNTDRSKGQTSVPPSQPAGPGAGGGTDSQGAGSGNAKR